MDLGNGLGHLTYSTLVHPADNWDQLWSSLQTFVPKVKARVSPNAPFGVCIRLAAPTAELLSESPAERTKLKNFLADNDMYVYTANAFPYGAFKGTVVKEQVYEPDWRSEARTQYTMAVADILADIGTNAVPPSIQTAPLGFKPNVTGPDVVASYTEHVLRVVAHLIQIEQRTGRLVTLAIEPEPHCFLETTDETVDYFTNHLYSGASATRLGKLASLPISEAHVALRKHLGIVFDIGHQAVGFEHIPTSLQKLVDAGIPIFKLQEVAAMHIPEVTQTGGRCAGAVRQDGLPVADRAEEGRTDHEVPEPGRCVRRVDVRPGPARMAHAFPRAGLPRGSRRLPHDALRARRRARVPQGRLRCRVSSRSRPTPGTCCPNTSRPATSSTTSAARSSG